MEKIVVARCQIEDDGKSARLSQVGCTYLVDGELKSLLFQSRESPYTVMVQDFDDDDISFRAVHVFVSRYLKAFRIDGPVEIWRWHVDVWQSYNEPVPSYVEEMYQIQDGDEITRHSFEHIDGHRLADPHLLSMRMASGDIELAVVGRDLVPDRNWYRKHYEALPHPGCFPMSMGISAYFEDLLARGAGPAPVALVN